MNNDLCECCGIKEGKFAQAPWPVPMSTSHCNDCAELESIAYDVWRVENIAHKFDCPAPFLDAKDIQELPIDYKKLSFEGIKSYLRNLLEKKNKLHTKVEKSNYWR